MSNIKRIPPVNFNPNAPALYGQGLTDYEILVRIATQINECIDTINSYDELAHRLAKYLEDFEETVKDDITAIITEWYEDGTLKDMIQDIITPYIRDEINSNIAKSFDIGFVHSGQFLKYTGKNWAMFDSKGRNNPYSKCDGGCEFYWNGEHYWADVCGYYGVSQGEHTNSRVSLYKDDNCIVPVTSFTISTYHAQSMCFDDVNGYLYITKTSTEDAWGDSGIYRYNMNTQQLELKQFNVINGGEFWQNHQGSTSYKQWYSIDCVKDNDGNVKLYGFKSYARLSDHNHQNGQEVYLLDFDNPSNITLVDILLMPNCYSTSTASYSNTPQSMAINDKYIASMSVRPNLIYIYDRATETTDINSVEWLNRKPIWCYSIPNILDNIYYTGEPEDIQLDNEGNLNMVTISSLNSNRGWLTSFTALTTIARHYTSNIYQGVRSKSVNEVSQVGSNNAEVPRDDLQLDFTVNWNTNHINPTGSADMPFKTAQQAIATARACGMNAVTISLETNDFLPLFIPAGMTVQLRLNAHKIGGVNCFGGSVYIKGDDSEEHKGTITQTCLSTNITAPLFLVNGCNFGVIRCKCDKEGVTFGDDGGRATTYDLTAYQADGYYTELTNYSNNNLSIHNVISRVN